MGSPVGKIAAHRGNGMQLFLLHPCPSSDLIVEVLGYPDAVALLSFTQWGERFLFSTTFLFWMVVCCLHPNKFKQCILLL